MVNKLKVGLVAAGLVGLLAFSTSYRGNKVIERDGKEYVLVGRQSLAETMAQEIAVKFPRQAYRITDGIVNTGRNVTQNLENEVRKWDEKTRVGPRGESPFSLVARVTGETVEGISQVSSGITYNAKRLVEKATDLKESVRDWYTNLKR